MAGAAKPTRPDQPPPGTVEPPGVLSPARLQSPEGVAWKRLQALGVRMPDRLGPWYEDHWDLLPGTFVMPVPDDKGGGRLFAVPEGTDYLGIMLDWPFSNSPGEWYTTTNAQSPSVEPRVRRAKDLCELLLVMFVRLNSRALPNRSGRLAKGSPAAGSLPCIDTSLGTYALQCADPCGPDGYRHPLTAAAQIGLVWWTLIERLCAMEADPPPGLDLGKVREATRMDTHPLTWRDGTKQVLAGLGAVLDVAAAREGVGASDNAMRLLRGLVGEPGVIKMGRVEEIAGDLKLPSSDKPVRMMVAELVAAGFVKRKGKGPVKVTDTGREAAGLRRSPGLHSR